MNMSGKSAQLHIGILGCGKMGKIYADWFSKNPHCRVTSFYNRTLATARELSATYPGSAAAEDWRKVVNDPSIDIVGICTPSHEHPEQFIAAVGAGKHTLCEKPMANNVNDCRRMVKAASMANMRTMVGFQMRYHPVVLRVTELLERIGRIYCIDFHFGMYRPETGWKHAIGQQGGVMKELLSHLIDLAYQWLGDAESIYGVNRIIRGDREVEDFTRNIIEYSNGATVTLAGDLFDRRSRTIQGNIMGLDGQIEFAFSSYDPADSRIRLFTGEGGPPIDIPVAMPAEIDLIYPGHLDSFKKEIDAFVEAVRSGYGLSDSILNGMNAMEIIDASYESQRSGNKVALPMEDFDTGNIGACFKRF